MPRTMPVFSFFRTSFVQGAIFIWIRGSVARFLQKSKTANTPCRTREQIYIIFLESYIQICPKFKSDPQAYRRWHNTRPHGQRTESAACSCIYRTIFMVKAPKCRFVENAHDSRAYVAVLPLVARAEPVKSYRYCESIAWQPYSGLTIALGEPWDEQIYIIFLESYKHRQCHALFSFTEYVSLQSSDSITKTTQSTCSCI